MQEFYAGCGSGVIRFPGELFPLEGFEKVHNDPQARVLVLACGEAAAIVSLELVMLPPEEVELVKRIVSERAGVKPERVWVHTTHAITTPHSPHKPIGPGGRKLEAGEPPEEIERKRKLYLSAVKQAVIQAAEAAVPVQPARLRLGQCRCLVNINRDVETPYGWWIGLAPEGKSNHTVTVLRADALDGSPVGALISYGLKPCAIDNSQMEEGKRQVSSDVPGFACRLLEDAIGAPCLFCMSAAGDQVPREQALLEEVLPDGTVRKLDAGVEAGLEIVERLGREMADAVLPAIQNAAPIDPAPLVSGRTSIRWPGKGRTKMEPRKVPDFCPDGEQEVSAQILTLGKVALVGLKPELNAVTEEQLQAASPFPYTLVLSMVDGGQKYMPDQASYDRVTWEAQSAPFMPGAAEAWVNETVRLLEHLSRA